MNEKRCFFPFDKPTSRIPIKIIASCHKITDLLWQRNNVYCQWQYSSCSWNTEKRARGLCDEGVRDFFPDGDRGGEGRSGRGEQERSPRIKSARIKNASSETSYSRFLPVVGINRPFRRRCINRDRGRATFLRPTLVVATPPGVEWLLLFWAHSLRYPRSLTIKLPSWRTGASIVEEVCWVVIYSSTRSACNVRYVYTGTQGLNLNSRGRLT